MTIKLGMLGIFHHLFLRFFPESPSSPDLMMLNDPVSVSLFINTQLVVACVIRWIMNGEADCLLASARHP